MARRAPKQRLALPETLDLTAAAPLAQALLARRGSSLCVDAGQVRRVGALAMQVLLSAAATWKADGVTMQVEDPSPELLSALELLGIAPAELGLRG